MRIGYSKIEPGRPRLTADLARGRLAVLRLDRLDDLAGLDELRGHAIRIEPDTHGVLAPECVHVAHSGDPPQDIEYIDLRVIVQVRGIVTAVGRDQVDHADHVRRGLLDGHAELLHFRRQHGLGRLDAVLDVDRGNVLRIADVEGRNDIREAVAGAVRAKVDHPFDAVDLLLDRRAHGLGHGLGIGAGVGGGDLDLGGRDLGILRNGQDEEANATDQEHEQGQHGRKNRPPDEEVDHAVAHLAREWGVERREWGERERCLSPHSPFLTAVAPCWTWNRAPSPSWQDSAVVDSHRPQVRGLVRPGC